MLWQISRRPELAFRTLPGAVYVVLDGSCNMFIRKEVYLRVAVTLE